MKQKAQLDILDVPVEFHEDDLPDAVLPDAVAGESATASRRVTLKQALIWGGLLFLALLLAVAVFWAIRASLPEEAEKPKTQTAVSPAVPFTETPKIALDDFFVNIPDGKGQFRIVHCSFALEATPEGEKAAGQQSREIRNTILALVQKRSLAALMDAKEKTALKKEILEAINGPLKGGVKAVYITKFVIL